MDRFIELIPSNQDKKLDKHSAAKAFKEVQQCVQQLNANQGYRVPDSHHFLVHVQGLLGKLPITDDIKATCGTNFDLLSAFQTFFVFEGDIYALTTYSCPLEKYGSFMMNEIDCFLVLGNENLYLSRKDCQETQKMIAEKNLNNVVMLLNVSCEKDHGMWEGQMENEFNNKEKNVGGVESLKHYMIEKNETVVNGANQDQEEESKQPEEKVNKKCLIF
ncbi:UNKNOWN [Stylonychia lemnae]|uniref:Uncharacterized protein n=1 Tax=Stylonychia lemnae TaxID=5949 RepID=A0A078A1F5_STYLE|nr:UNKNOWN [Stylonychia lemnae]|eukprot:CDW75308.1 UNKNOWN [Stylonychia lemnae]